MAGESCGDGCGHMGGRCWCVATVVGQWLIKGDQFEPSGAVVDGQLLDLSKPPPLTEARLDAWLKQIAPVFGLPG